MKLLAAAAALFTLVVPPRLAAQNEVTFAGGIAIDAKFPLPKVIAVRAWRVGSESSAPLTLSCPIEHARWTCSIPAGTYDLQLHAIGFVPRYLWGVRISEGIRDIGRVALASGATVNGVVRDDGGPTQGVLAELTPENGASGPDRRRARLRSQTAVTRPDGTFEIADVDRGSYLLTVRKPGYGGASRSGILVQSDQPVRVGTIDLKRSANLRVYLTPEVDFDGQPWKIALTRTLPASDYWQLVRKGTVGVNGFWSADDLDDGKYRLVLLSSKGNRTDQRDIDLLSDQIVTIAVVAIPVHGWLTVGGEPLAAAFSLVSDDGVRIDFKSNDRGMFSGVLTREGVWRPIVRLSGAALNLKPLAVRKAPSGGAEIKIELPGGEIVGRVVDSEGDPASASVLVFHDEQLEISAQTDENGAFRLRGLETGSRLIQAIAPAGESGRIAVDVGNHDAATVTLTIAAARRLRERLLDAAGDAVPGATIYFQNPRSEQRRTESGLTGDFTLVVPADAGVVWAAVVAPGLPIKFFSIAASDAGDGQQFVMGSASGRLEIQLHGSVPPWPTVSRRGDAPFALFQLFVPHAGGPPREYRPPATYSLDVEPGIYDICLSTASVCRVATVAAGSQATVQLATEK